MGVIAKAVHVWLVFSQILLAAVTTRNNFWQKAEIWNKPKPTNEHPNGMFHSCPSRKPGIDSVRINFWGSAK